jgi:hypothetical protein
MLAVKEIRSVSVSGLSLRFGSAGGRISISTEMIQGKLEIKLDGEG